VLAGWDRLVGGTEGTDVTQLSAWARVRALAGYRPIYLLAYQRAQLVGGALVLWRRLWGVVPISYLPYGPVIGAEVGDRAAVRAALVEELVGFADRQRLMFVQPPEHADDVSAALLARGFRPSKAGIAPAGSYRLDLTRPLEQIRAGFSKRLKSWTNRWESKGVRVRRGDERDLPLLARLMAATARRQGFRPPPLEYLRTLYRELDALGAVALFVGEVHGVPVSADVVTVCAGMVRGRLGGFDAVGEAAKLSVPAAVRWETIKWAKRQGLRYLDFGGLPEPMLTDMIDRGIHSSDEWPSAQRSKLQFNGQPFRYPTPVERVHPPALRAVYDLAIAHPAGTRLVNKVKDALRGNRAQVTAHAGDKYH
jgi:lipid II:glycine glycyltransferase (peptidoglycan interpeptide bridge formation enzyme)